MQRITLWSMAVALVAAACGDDRSSTPSDTVDSATDTVTAAQATDSADTAAGTETEGASDAGSDVGIDSAAAATDSGVGSDSAPDTESSATDTDSAAADSGVGSDSAPDTESSATDTDSAADSGVGSDSAPDTDSAVTSDTVDAADLLADTAAWHFSTDGCTYQGAPCDTAVVIVEDSDSATVFTVLSKVEADAVVVHPGVVVQPAQYQPGVAESGTLFIAAQRFIYVAEGAVLSAYGRGFGGGGGGAGQVYGDSNICAKTITSPGGGTGGPVDGALGQSPEVAVSLFDSSMCSRTGGAGGGFGGEAGQDSRREPYDPPGAGGAGAGLFGGRGGLPQDSALRTCGQNARGCAYRELPGGNGQRGGYLAPAANGDTAADDDAAIYLGSGGGGGAGGYSSSGWCCGGGWGGAGGLANAEGECSCNSGGGGSGGAAGGGRIALVADAVIIDGALHASGAGSAVARGGYGAGGGVLLVGVTRVAMGPHATVRSLGGDYAAAGVTNNGGTLKVRTPRWDIDPDDVADLESTVGRLSYAADVPVVVDLNPVE